jgi:hypothetical protein
VRARVSVCVYRSRGRRFYRSGRLLVTCGVSYDVKEALVSVVWAKSKKIRKNKKCGVCYLAGAGGAHLLLLLLLAFLNLAL